LGCVSSARRGEDPDLNRQTAGQDQQRAPLRRVDSMVRHWDCGSAGLVRMAMLRALTAISCFALAACSAPPRRIDPIFGLEPPLLSGDRGGAGEAPESTELAFDTAVTGGVDVLELDVQLTRDRQFVVWHGPKLDNVRIAGQDNETPRMRSRREI